MLVGALILAPMACSARSHGTTTPCLPCALRRARADRRSFFVLTAIAFFSLSVWSSGDALVGGAKRLVDLPETDLTLALAYGLFALLVLTVCIYVFRIMLWSTASQCGPRACVPARHLAFAPAFDSQYAGSVALGQAGFWVGIHRRGGGAMSSRFPSVRSSATGRDTPACNAEGPDHAGGDRCADWQR